MTSGAGCFYSCTHMATVGVKGLRGLGDWTVVNKYDIKSLIKV